MPSMQVVKKKRQNPYRGKNGFNTFPYNTTDSCLLLRQ
jgi:hypothetical protein